MPTTTRSPIVAIMGHVDHGKSTLLDYIRKTNIVDGEAGGITQHLSAYEVTYTGKEKKEEHITFIDTPGHAAFSGMRSRGAQIADIAILIVSAEDSVKTQTLEALATIRENNVPFIVAINKVDKPGANAEKVKYDLMEHEVYVEGLGGTTPVVLISAKTGLGVPELLETITLVAELEQFTADASENAEGLVIEAKTDPKRGSQATLIIKNGTVKSGQYIVAGTAIAPTRMLENFLAQPVKSAGPSSPIRIAGWSTEPVIGTTFHVFDTKKEAEEYIISSGQQNGSKLERMENDIKYIPLIIKTDVAGTAEAIEKEVKKLNQDTIRFHITGRGVGNISENDIKTANTTKDALIVGFNVKIDGIARDLNDQLHMSVQCFDVIYKLTEYLAEIIEARRPRVETLESLGTLKVLKTFGQTKERQVIGGKVIEGKIETNTIVRIMRRDNEIGRGKVVEVQKGKSKAREVLLDEECGLQIEGKVEIAQGDILESFIMTHK